MAAAGINNAIAEWHAKARDALARGEERTLLRPLAAAAQRHDDAALWQWAALLFRSIDEHAAALTAIGHAVRLAPNTASIAHARARIALEAGLPAREYFAEAHRLAPNDGDVLLGQAAAIVAAGDREGAIAGLDAMLSRHPGWLPGHEAVSRLRWEAGDHDGFARSFVDALRAAPRDANLWRSYIIMAVHARNWRQVAMATDQAVAHLGDQPFIVANRAVMLSETGDAPGADAGFAALEGREDATFMAHRLRHELRFGRPERAAVLGEAWSKRADNVLIWPYLSLAWRMTDDARWDWLEGDDRLTREVDLPLEEADMHALRTLLSSLHSARSGGIDQSVRGGSQTDGPLFSRIEEPIRKLRGMIVDAVRGHIAQLPPRDPSHPTLRWRRDAEPRFSGSWSVRLAAEGHHANHIHPMGWFSSALYVTLPADVAGGADRAEGAITDGCLSQGIPESHLGLAMPPTRVVRPKVGRLALFPSTMWHGTYPFSDGERMTVAFDVAYPNQPG